jgi:hypothetical protein
LQGGVAFWVSGARHGDPPGGVHFLEEADGAFDHRTVTQFIVASQ